MSTDSWIDVAIAVVSLVILGFAAVVETSLAVVNRVTLRALIEERISTHRGVQSLVDQPQAVRSSMLLIELVAAVLFGTALSSLFNRELAFEGTLIAVLVAVVALLVFGRVVPSIIVANEQTAETRSFRGIASVLSLLARPLVLVSDLLIRIGSAVVRRPSREPEEAQVVEELARGDENGAAEQAEIEEEEHEMISAILHLDEACAREIMVPRPDIVAASVDTPVVEVVELARTRGHSRIPVYRDSIDSIVGVVYAKDFLRFVEEDLQSVLLADLLRPAYFVPESKRVDELLKDLRKEKVHLAVVVDEYGGTSGIVTIEDILEEIVGEIQDEYDREMPLIERIGPEEAIVDGRLSIGEVEDIFETEFAEGDFDTVGGFVQRQLGRIPDEGESVRFANLLFEVQSVEHRRIRKLRVVRIDEPIRVEETANVG